MKELNQLQMEKIIGDKDVNYWLCNAAFIQIVFYNLFLKRI
ncbi:MAG: hypothetical protein QHH13_02715 [Melioribacter sp.]|jgi:hypothetical protein|nr:hypothetical protein [Melioribacter sp.]